MTLFALAFGDISTDGFGANLSCGTAATDFYMLDLPSFSFQTTAAIAGACLSVILAIHNTPEAQKTVSWFARVLLILAGTSWPLLLAVRLEGQDLFSWSGYTVLGWLLLYGSTVDLASYRLPNAITYASFALLILIRTIEGALNNSLVSGLMFTLSGAFFAAGGLWLVQKIYFNLRKKHGIGGGDIKLLLSLGGGVGMDGILVMLLIASVLALLAALAQSCVKHTVIAQHSLIPFGPFLCLGAAASFLWRNEILSA